MLLVGVGVGWVGLVLVFWCWALILILGLMISVCFVGLFHDWFCGCRFWVCVVWV